MGAVQLPIVQSPLTVSQFLAYPLVVLLNYPECLPWIHSNYIQLEYFKDIRGESLSFVGGWVTDIPWIRFQYFEKKDFISSNGDIQSAIKNYINDGWYFYSIFDEFYVPSRTKYNKIHFSFDFMLYGYDDAAEEYSVLGYSSKGIFEATKIKYNDFIKAFESAFEYQPFVILYQKRDDFSFELDRKYFHDMIDDYLNSRNTSARLGITQRETIKNRIFGLDTYECLIRHFKMNQAKYSKDNMLLYRSSRTLHVLWEHKKCMLLRFEYFNQHGFIDNIDKIYRVYQQLENNTLMLRNLHLQYSVKEDNRLLDQIMNSLLEIRQLESNVLEDLLELTKET
jgi:hypothetical protein